MIAFVADHAGPPRRRLYLWRDDTNSNPGGADNGWDFQVTEFTPFGDEVPVRDAWAETFAEILSYPDVYVPRTVQWREENSGKAVDIYSLALAP